jgi:hypothetical protein
MVPEVASRCHSEAEKHLCYTILKDIDL